MLEHAMVSQFSNRPFQSHILKKLKQGHTSAKENQPRHVLRNFRNKNFMLSLSSLTKEK